MDVLCVGMYRACSTWQYEVAAHLVERYRTGRRLGFVQSDEYTRGANGAWRVLKSHEGGPAFRKALGKKRALAIYAIRDPRDVVYSMLHKRNQDFETFLRQGMIHQIFANHRFWMQFPRAHVLLQRYEEIVADPSRAVGEIAAHLGISLPQASCRALAAEYSFKENKRRTELTARRMVESGLSLDDPENIVRYDARSLLHWNHMRDGQIGSWRGIATPRELSILAAIAGPWIVEYGYAEREELEAVPNATVEDQWAIAHGWMNCRLRCASLQYPKLSGFIKRRLGLKATFQASPIEVPLEQAA